MPALVTAATGRARAAGFRLSCEPAVGQLLAVLAAHLPAGARVLELGTGRGGRYCLDCRWAAARRGRHGDHHRKGPADGGPGSPGRLAAVC